MYCSSCGASVARGLSYCKQCGAKLRAANEGDASKSPEIKPETIIQSIVAVFVCGIGAITVLIGVMKAVLNLDLRIIVGFALLSFLIMILIEAVFIRLLLRGKRESNFATDIAERKGQITTELDSAQERALPEPEASITENTTRIFEPLLNKTTTK